MLEVKRKPNETAALRSYPQPEIRPASPAENLSRPNRSEATVPVLVPVPKESASYQTRTPVITGEAYYRGMLPVDGVVVGQLGAHNGSLAIRQKTTSSFASRAELSGEISFRDMLRVNGHIAGTVYSKTGSLIVDNSATVDANIEVAISIIHGTVHGDIVARERVEIGPSAKIYGNIWTRSISIKDGAVFDGVCNMIGEKRVEQGDLLVSRSV